MSGPRAYKRCGSDGWREHVAARQAAHAAREHGCPLVGLLHEALEHAADAAREHEQQRERPTAARPATTYNPTQEQP